MHPGRGDAGAYQRYLGSMDASMRQKVAMTAAHLLGRGRVADMGMGSGAGTAALAALYPELTVVGVDVDPRMVELAREKHALPNLSFVVGDIAERVFPPRSLDGIFDSSVLHHVTSFGGYDHARAGRALAAQAEALADHGVLIVRDFVDPGPGEVLLDLRADDGDASDDPRTMSTARLLERFAREFRPLSRAPGFPCRRVEGAPAGFQRFRLSRTHAAELVLRKDYRADWEQEVLEEYTYFTREEFEEAFARLGMRVLASTPLHNPWIVRRRFRGQIALHDLDGAPIEPPATNYCIVGEKVPPGEGVGFRVAGEAPPLGFLVLEHHRDRRDGRVRDLVRRPNVTVDVLPHFVVGDDLFVLARRSYPRPILQTSADPPLGGGRLAGYVTEPLTVVLTDKPIGQAVEEALSDVAHLEARALRAFFPGTTYYPSAGGLQEEVRSIHVEVDPVFVEERIANVSGFSSSGRVRAIEARQLLRAAQVGGLPDARLELNVYDLLAKRGVDPGPWIGEGIELPEAAAPPPGLTTMAALSRRPPRRAFERVGAADSPGFLTLRCLTFEELDAEGLVVATRDLELVEPRTRSTNTVATALLWRHGGTVWLGIDDDDLPAAQSFHGASQLLVAPAWRLPRGVASSTPARAWVKEALAREYGLVTGELWELGGPYTPAPGSTPELVTPLAVEVRAVTGGGRALAWVPLADAVRERAALLDGHLRVVALRAAHALG